jgi:hypothetical protein
VTPTTTRPTEVLGADLHRVEWVVCSPHLVLSASRRIARAATLYVPRYLGDVTLSRRVDAATGAVVIVVTAHPSAIRIIARWA